MTCQINKIGTTAELYHVVQTDAQDVIIVTRGQEVQYYCGRLDFKHIVDKHMVHFFSKVDKMNNDVVQQCFSNFKRGDKFKRLRND